MQEQGRFRRHLFAGAALVVGVAWTYGTIQLSLAVRKLSPLAAEAIEGRVLPPVGAFIPVLQGQSLAGDDVRLGEMAKGRSQVLFAIQASCPTCREMMPELRAMADSLAASPDHDVVWLSLSADDSTEAYVIEHGIRQPVFLTKNERTSVLLGVRAVPTIVVVDSDGRIRYRHAGRFASPIHSDSVVQMAAAAKEVWRRRTAPEPDSVFTPVASRY